MDFKDSVPPPAQPGVRSHPGRNSQDGVSHQQETDPLFLPLLNKLHQGFYVRGEDASNLTTIPLQSRVTLQILNHSYPFKDLKETFAVSRRGEQLCLLTKQRIVASVEDSVLRTQMENLESQEEDDPKRVL